MASRAISKDSITEAVSLLDHLTTIWERRLVDISNTSTCDISKSVAQLELIQVLKDVSTAANRRYGCANVIETPHIVCFLFLLCMSSLFNRPQ